MNVKKIMCLLTATFLLSAQSISAEAFDSSEHLEVSTAMNYSYFAGASQPSAEITVDADALPSSFDLRDKNLVSSVKNQKSYAICWAESTVSILETELITDYPDIDLSEWQLAYYTYSKKFGFPLPETSPDPEDAFLQGGNYFLLTPMLVNWISPALESDYPFEQTKLLDPDAEAKTLQAQSAFHVTDSCLIEYDPYSDNFENQINNMKQIIYDGHAVALNYINVTANYTTTATGSRNFYNTPNSLQNGSYHAVTVVGWDDNYSASNFKTTPDRDGAWLCKNSWGSSWGNDGYFWMSYAEESCLQPYYLKVEEKNQHYKQFYHDDFGWWSSVSFVGNGSTAYMANVFTADEDTLLTSAMFATAMENENYEVQVYKNLRSSSRPTSGTPSAGTTSGKVESCGYHTVALEKPVRLQAGETFSVVVKLSGDSGKHITCESYVTTTMEYPDGTANFRENISEEQLLENFSPKQSFYSATGNSWSDIYSAGVINDVYNVTENGQTVEVTTDTKLGNLCVRGVAQLLGDVNLDGVVDASDAADILIYAAELGSGDVSEEKDAQWIGRADLSNDGNLNADDASQLLQLAAKLGAGEE